MKQKVDTVDDLNKIFDHIAKTEGNERAGKICAKLGWDNPHIQVNFSYEKMVEITDKFIKFNKLLNGAK